MTRLRAVVLALLILAVSGPAGRAAERPSAEEESPLASLHSPLEDPQAGRLYPLAADLLRAASTCGSSSRPKGPLPVLPRSPRPLSRSRRCCSPPRCPQKAG